MTLRSHPPAAAAGRPDVGIVVFPGDGLIRPVDLARAVEDRGFDALFVPEHTHMPVRRSVEFVLDRALPDIYRRSLDPFVTLTAAAAVTTRLTLGTSISLVAQRDPIVTAKMLASLDQVSGGRLVLGVGAGWNIEEMAHHGVDPARRWARVAEHVAAMRALWTADIAEFHGEFVDFEPSWAWPKPVNGIVPVLVGGSGPRSLDRAARWGDGWLPALDESVEPLLHKIRALRDRLAEHSATEFDVTVACGYGRRLDAGEFAALAKEGVGRILLAIDSMSYEETTAALDAAAASARAASWLPTAME